MQLRMRVSAGTVLRDWAQLLKDSVVNLSLSLREAKFLKFFL